MSNYYSNQIKGYVANYQGAINNIDAILSPIEELYTSFAGATGDDINRIRSDINAIVTNLAAVKEKLKSAMQETVRRANSCDSCYEKYKNKEYGAYETGDRKYSYGANVYIDGSGMIHVVREYMVKHSFIESIFISSAGEYYDDQVISLGEMLGN